MGAEAEEGLEIIKTLFNRHFLLLSPSGLHTKREGNGRAEYESNHSWAY